MKAVISSHASEFPLWCKWIWYLIIVKQLTTALKCTGRVHMHRGNFNTSTNRPIREIISVITKQMISTSLKFRSTKNKNQRNCSVCISKTKNKTHAKNLRVHKVYHSNPLHTQRSKFSFLFSGNIKICIFLTAVIYSLFNNQNEERQLLDLLLRTAHSGRCSAN